jgi:hypothetical protein
VEKREEVSFFVDNDSAADWKVGFFIINDYCAFVRRVDDLCRDMFVNRAKAKAKVFSVEKKLLLIMEK